MITKAKKTGYLAFIFFLLGCSREFELDAQFSYVKMTVSGNPATTELGGTVTVFVSLSQKPTADVAFALQSSNTAEGQIRATGNQCDAASAAVTALPCQLTFTPANWDKPQPVVVVGQDDPAQDGDIVYKILVPETVVSQDPQYSGLIPAPLTLTNTDNDAGAGFILSRISGLVTSEAPGSDSFSIRLASQPSSNVVLNFTSSNVNEGTPTPASVTFTNVTWNTDRTIIVTGVADQRLDGDVSYSITIAVQGGSDPAYAPLTPPSVSVTNSNTDAGKYIYVTSASYVGAPAGVGGIAGADAKCNADAGKPTAGVYKAVLGGYNTNTTSNVRDSTLDWALAVNQKYYRVDGYLIGTTNAGAIFNFPMLRSFHTGAITYWTGLNPAATWQSNTGVGNFTCSNTNGAPWLTGGGGYLGNGAATDNTAVYSPPSVVCAQSHRLLCAEL